MRLLPSYIPYPHSQPKSGWLPLNHPASVRTILPRNLVNSIVVQRWKNLRLHRLRHTSDSVDSAVVLEAPHAQDDVRLRRMQLRAWLQSFLRLAVNRSRIRSQKETQHPDRT